MESIMNHTETYKYNPLLEPDGFRIVVLHPSPSVTTSISCSVIHSTLLHYDKSIIDHYTALSYVWGDASDKRTILVDGKTLAITATLDSALRHIRDRKCDLKIWADGICIDQLDVEDKNKQVRLMGSIYKLARHTIIYLGDSTPETDELFNILDSPLSSTFDPDMGSGFIANIRYPRGNSTYEMLLRGSPYSGRTFWVLMRDHVLNRPWFTRVWVLQELVLSGDPWVQIGVHRHRWNYVYDLVLENHEDDTSQLPHVRHHGFRRLADMQELRDNFVAPITTKSPGPAGTLGGPCDYLLHILHSRRGSGVSDGRDMIYAHLGIFRDYRSDPELSNLIRVDYNKSFSEVYTDLALYLLRRQHSFGFLSHVENRPVEERNPELPSWVPDWTVADVSPDAENHLRAHTSVGARHDVTHLYFERPKALACIGNVLGTIRVIKPDMPSAEEVAGLLRIVKETKLSHRPRSQAEMQKHTDPSSSMRKDDHSSASSEFINHSDTDGSTDGDNLYDTDDDSLKWRPLGKDELKQAYSILYKHLRSWLGTDFLPAVKKMHVPLHDELGYGSFGRKMLNEIFSPPTGEPRHPINPYIAHWNSAWDNPEAGSPEPLLLQVLMAMTEVHGHDFLAGKKLGVLNTGEITFVSPWAQVGDLVCSFNDRLSHVYALRPIKPHEISNSLDPPISHFFAENKEIARKKYVKYTHNGTLIWNKDLLYSKRLSYLHTNSEDTPRHQRIWAKKYNREVEALKERGKSFDATSNNNEGSQLDPDLKAQMETLTYSVLEHELGIGTEQERMLWETDTSKVGHFHFIGECIVDSPSPIWLKQSEDGIIEDKGDFRIITLH